MNIDMQPKGMANSGGIGELPDTGVTNGRLLPGQVAKLSAMVILATIVFLPIIF